MVPAVLLSRRHDFGVHERADRPAFWPSLWDAVPGLLAPVVILGGLRSGLFTPTEAAAVAVAYGLLVGVVIYRNMGFAEIGRVLAESAETSAIIMIIISLAGLFAWAGSPLGRSEERLVGKECVSQGRSWWSPHQLKKT